MNAELLEDDFIAAAVALQPYFEAVRERFAAFDPGDGKLQKLERLAMWVDERVRDSPRHFAGCRDDGSVILVAPQLAELPEDTVLAILCHEAGHAADFSYPAAWELVSRDEPARWMGEIKPGKLDRQSRKRLRAWHDRTQDQVEWTADAICHAVLGKRIGYCGPCYLQCFDGPPRPDGLR